MAQVMNMRAASFAASSLMVGAAVFAALTVSYTVQTVLRDGFQGVTMIEAAPPEEPEPLTRRKIEPPPTTPEALDQNPLFPIEQAPPTVVQTGGFAVGPAESGPVAIAHPAWERRPRDLYRYYPRRAREAGIEGAVQLDCRVSTLGMLDCSVISESPPDWGFAAAAIRMARDYRMTPATRDGRPVEGRYRMRVPFELS